MTQEQVNKGGQGHYAWQLSPVQLKVLKAAADGAPLRVVAQRVGLPVAQVSTRLTQVYRRLGVANVPLGRTPDERRQRRQLAVQEARRRGHRL